ncbi:DUF2520 domain-containing protein [Pedobacter sp. BS3]|uniref:Rossmann-like and DUF2520 domain-containing protein n=1 Tax=Pedobacter sp. BS3 TaxID=2567937 RepID=UPI0011ED4D36|nr:Rossmann-like and DUF2520 domain-containing protein [Pedobacter sp. BS3]TZF83727.1 DUF2520 domain-containing protein [Pedobacter sp. BS3]
MKISFIGSGNVATHLAAALYNAGHVIAQVYSRDIQHASLLAYHVRAQAITGLAQLNSDVDLIIIAVSDDAIPQLVQQLKLGKTLVVHTSGSTGMDVLKPVSKNTGVIYPLQTFSKVKEVDFRNVPVAVEANSEENAKVLTLLMQDVSDKVFYLTSEKRLALHVSAVFACNFTNYLYTVAQQILTKHDLDFDLIRPLIAETAAKVQEHLPADAQTGPAVRNDKYILQKHIDFLLSQPALQELYRQISQQIINLYDNPGA